MIASVSIDWSSTDESIMINFGRCRPSVLAVSAITLSV